MTVCPCPQLVMSVLCSLVVLVALCWVLPLLLAADAPHALVSPAARPTILVCPFAV